MKDLTYKNRRGEVYYFARRKTKSGTTQIVATRKKPADPVTEIPEGKEIYETANGQVFCRKKVETLIEGNKFLHMRVVTDREYVPKKAAFSTDEGACFADVAAECPTWLFRTDWNLLKVTRRGALSSSEVCRIDRISRSFHFIVR